MTAQVRERLIYNGVEHGMCTEPLGDYFAFGGRRPDFKKRNSGCWRGYIGTWEVVEKRLYLIKLAGLLANGEETDLATVFPGYGDRVFAHWFTDTVRVPQGEMLRYVHQGYGSVYERDLFLRFSKGELLYQWERENGIAEPDDLGDDDE